MSAVRVSQRARRWRKILSDVMDLAALAAGILAGAAGVFLLCLIVMGWH